MSQCVSGYFSSRLRSIQAVFSWTSRRWVSRSAVGWSWRCHQREQLRARARHGFLGADQMADHSVAGHAFDFRDRGQLDELLVGRRGPEDPARGCARRSGRAHPLLGVLAHEHQVQRVEHRPGDVPVEVVRHQVERVAVGEQGGKSLRDSCARRRRCRCRSQGLLAFLAFMVDSPRLTNDQRGIRQQTGRRHRNGRNPIPERPTHAAARARTTSLPGRVWVPPDPSTILSYLPPRRPRSPQCPAPRPHPCRRPGRPSGSCRCGGP